MYAQSGKECLYVFAPRQLLLLLLVCTSTTSTVVVIVVHFVVSVINLLTKNLEAAKKCRKSVFLLACMREHA